MFACIGRFENTISALSASSLSRIYRSGTQSQAISSRSLDQSDWRDVVIWCWNDYLGIEPHQAADISVTDPPQQAGPAITQRSAGQSAIAEPRNAPVAMQ
jgi:hypothetical protein